MLILIAQTKVKPGLSLVFSIALWLLIPSLVLASGASIQEPGPAQLSGKKDFPKWSASQWSRLLGQDQQESLNIMGTQAKALMPHSKTINPAQQLLDRLYTISAEAPTLQSLLALDQHPAPANLAAFTGMSLAAACEILDLSEEKCPWGNSSFSPMGKKFAFLYFSQESPLNYNSWTNASWGETLLVLAPEHIETDLYPLVQALLHELAIQLDSKSNHAHHYLSNLNTQDERGNILIRSIKLDTLRWMNEEFLVKIFRSLRAFRFEAKVLAELGQKYELVNYETDYAPFLSFGRENCIQAVKILERHFRSSNLSVQIPYKNLARRSEFTKRSWCEELADPILEGSPLLDGSGPRPRIGSWD